MKRPANWPTVAVAAGLLATLSGGALSQGNEPRDIEQVWKRPDNQLSWATMFHRLVNENSLNRSVAIVIGLSDYSKYWKPLEAPWYDALRVRDYFIRSGFDYVVTLTNRKATKQNIGKYMEDILPAEVGANDRFVFYFSGHGTQRTLFNALRGYLPMLDSEKDDWSSMIGMDEIANWSQNFNQARHSLFVLDSCFSGLAGEQAKGEDYVKVYMNDLLQPGHFLVTAGSAGQESYASVQRWGGSLFTYAFLQGINGAADSGTAQFPPDGVISLTKLYDYIRRSISAERTRSPQVDQTPLLSDLTPKSLGEPFFIADPAKAKPRFVTRGDGGAGNDSGVVSKGSAAVPPKGPSLATIVSVDRLYGNGLSDFPTWKFGKSLGELFPQYNWSQLPRASASSHDRTCGISC